MRRHPLLFVLAATLFAACDRPMPTEPAGGTGSENPPTGTTAPSDPEGAPVPPPIVPVDPTVYALTLSGSFTSSGTATGVLFLTSGSAMWNDGICTGDVALGTDGTWVSPTGTAGSAHDARCVGYWSDGRLGTRNKGTCTATPRGFIGLWANPGGRSTSPYHTKCLMRGTVTSMMTLTFSGSATLYVANDGSGRRILNFSSGDAVTGQLVYAGTATNYTTGTGSVIATDGGGALWTVDLTQAAFLWYVGQVNGDVIAELQGPGVEAVACSAATGCVLLTVSVGS